MIESESYATVDKDSSEEFVEKSITEQLSATSPEGHEEVQHITPGDAIIF